MAHGLTGVELEDVARRAMRAECSRNGHHDLTPEDEESMLLWLLEIVVLELVPKFDSLRSSSWPKYVFAVLRLRVPGWYRENLRDARYGWVEFETRSMADARERLGLSSADAAASVGVNPITYRRWEKWGHVPVRKAAEVAKVLMLELPDPLVPEEISPEAGMLEAIADQDDWLAESASRISLDRARIEQSPRRHFDSAHWRRACEQVLERDGYACRMAGCDVADLTGTLITVHHVRPLAADDVVELSNLVTVCLPHKEELEHRQRALTQADREEERVAAAG